MDEKFPISIEIAGKSYRLKIVRSQELEERARKAVVQIRQMIDKYRKIYGPDADVRDLLAMVVFHLSMDNLQLKEENDTSQFTKTIQQLTNSLDSYLKEQ